MPTPKYFSKVPPFPTDIPTANIPVISYTNLKSNTGPDSENLFEACKEQGFFLLDLRGNEDGDRMLKDAERMFDLSTATFDLGHEVLLKYKADLPKDVNGYKPPGAFKTENGKPDDISFYTLSRDDVLGLCSTREDPELFAIHRKECQKFFVHADKVVNDLLTHLDSHLGLAPGTLASLGPLDKPSATSLRFLHAHPQLDDKLISFGNHTDVGIITMLFNIVGGLQVLSADSDDWHYVRPEPGCAIINIGDTLAQWTGEILRSSPHRVVAPPGEQVTALRQSVAYPVRPARNGSMTRLSSHVIPPLSISEEEERRSVDEWAAWKTQEVMKGKLNLTRGGRHIGMGHPAKAGVTMVA